MTLYSADLLDLAKPVADKKGKKEKKVAIVPIPEKPIVEEVPKKKQATEKQLAALAKAQETRKRKREEEEQKKSELLRLEEEKRKEEEEAAAAILAKKEAQKEKRRLSREAKKLATPPDTSADGNESVEEIIASVVNEKPIKKQKVEENTPPTWFKQYIAGVKKEESKVSNDKKPQKQIQQEANQVAENQWKDGFTRDRVRNEVDNHMSRMYQMMFSGRRLK